MNVRPTVIIGNHEGTTTNLSTHVSYYIYYDNLVSAVITRKTSIDGRLSSTIGERNYRVRLRTASQ